MDREVIEQKLESLRRCVKRVAERTRSFTVPASGFRITWFALGGATKDADAGSLYVVRADGSVISRRQVSWLFDAIQGERLAPGDTIVVPESTEKFRWTKELKDWSQIFYQFALGVAGLKVLRDL